MQNIVLIDDSKTDEPSKISMSVFSFSDNLFQDVHIIFQNRVDNFEMAQKTCSILVWGAVPP